MKLKDLLNANEILTINPVIKTPFSKEKILEILSDAVNVYSPLNSEPYKLVYVRSKQIKDLISQATFPEVLFSEHIVVVDGDFDVGRAQGISDGSLYASVGMLIQNILLLSRERNLKSGLIMNFDESKFKSKMKLKEPIAIICFGNIVEKQQKKLSFSNYYNLDSVGNKKDEPELSDYKYDEYIAKKAAGLKASLKAFVLKIKNWFK